MFAQCPLFSWWCLVDVRSQFSSSYTSRGTTGVDNHTNYQHDALLCHKTHNTKCHITGWFHLISYLWKPFHYAIKNWLLFAQFGLFSCNLWGKVWIMRYYKHRISFFQVNSESPNYIFFSCHGIKNKVFATFYLTFLIWLLFLQILQVCISQFYKHSYILSVQTQFCQCFSLKACLLSLK